MVKSLNQYADGADSLADGVTEYVGKVGAVSYTHLARLYSQLDKNNICIELHILKNVCRQ